MLNQGRYIGVGSWRSITNDVIEPLEIVAEVKRSGNDFSISGNHRRHEGQHSSYFDIQANLVGVINWVFDGSHNSRDIVGVISRDNDSFNILANFERVDVILSASMIPKENGLRFNLLINKGNDIIDVTLDIYSESETAARENVVALRNNSDKCSGIVILAT
ncbi:hypothetical protein [Candidatus Thiodiazotropha sp. LNASS1]|uniref:hypothetical protein n=1 Tax=Candidatus Thiodiazotropha sp. LNASS1 TaxID=3096260 RepID=UPI0034E02EF2